MRRRISLHLCRFQKAAQIQIPRNETIVIKDHEPVLDNLGKYSLITTTRNEESNINLWLDSVTKQSLKPKEVIICDAGSDDRTVDLINKFKEKNKLPFEIRVIVAPNVNIARGRNLAVMESSSQVLLFSDVGTELDKNWANYLVSAFEDKDVEAALGWYEPLYSNSFFKSLSLFLLPQLDSIEPEIFMPSARSLAVKRSLFDDIGGFPENLKLAGEDSLFDFNLKFKAKKLAFVPIAKCKWLMPRSIVKMGKTIQRYSYGDAETGFLFWSYYYSLLKNILTLFFEFFIFVSFFVFGLAFKSKLILILSAIVFLTTALFYLKVILSYGPLRRGGGLREKICNFLAVNFMIFYQSIGFISGFKLEFDFKSVNEKE